MALSRLSLAFMAAKILGLEGRFPSAIPKKSVLRLKNP
jgi:hypothetical protein